MAFFLLLRPDANAFAYDLSQIPVADDGHTGVNIVNIAFAYPEYYLEYVLNALIERLNLLSYIDQLLAITFVLF